MPNFEMVDFMDDHFGNFTSNVAALENPLAQMASNDYALGRLVEAVSNSQYWKDTAIFVLEDDAQNGPDHVDAHRSTVFIASPYTKGQPVIHTNYNSTNVLRTIEDILGSYLGLNDANARPMSDVFIQQPRISGPTSRQFQEDHVPAAWTRHWYRNVFSQDTASRGQRLKRMMAPGGPRPPRVWIFHPDRIELARFNAVLAAGLMP